jgi:hypothetical protein
MNTGTAEVTFMGPDSARVRFTGQGSGGTGSSELIAATDAVGRLLGGTPSGAGIRDPARSLRRPFRPSLFVPSVSLCEHAVPRGPSVAAGRALAHAPTPALRRNPCDAR